MPPTAILARYTAEVLRFDFAQAAGSAVATPPDPQPPADPAAVARAAHGCLEALAREPRPFVLLLGLGTGALARELDAALPPETALVVSETDTRAARAALAEPDAPWSRPGGRATLVADTSPWAHFLLWRRAGITPGTAHLRLNPEARDPQHATLRRLFSRAEPVAPAPGGAAPPEIGLAAILAPTDPGLADFFAQLPPWLAEIVVVWDGEAPPAAPPACAAPTRHLARPLGADFAAQRNALLAACRADWVLTLDADERLDPGGFEAVRALAAAGDAGGPGSWLLPRRTLYPDAGHCLAGLGLWPDLQMKLFRRVPGLAYERPVHERLTGLTGPFGLAANLSVTHLNRLLRDAGGVRDKLAGFDRAAAGAGAGGVRHVLSEDYPHLPLGLLPDTDGPEGLDALALPFDPA